MFVPPVVEFEGEVEKLVVREDHLTNFNALIRWIRSEGIGANNGTFLMELHEDVIQTTDVEELGLLVETYFNQVSSQRGKLRKRKPDKQEFFLASEYEDVYGYRKKDCTDKEADTFRKIVSDVSSFANVETCCTKTLLKEGGSEADLLKHYWGEIRRCSVLSSAMVTKVKESEIESIIQRAEEVRHRFLPFMSPLVSSSTSEFHVQGGCLKSSECSNVKVPAILYGAGIPVKSKAFEVCKGFSLSKLGTILDVCKRKYPGIAYPYLYVGLTHSTFAWHIEDAALWSINFLHYGAYKVWFVVPPKYYDLLVLKISQFGLNPNDVSCSNVLGHKNILASPEVLKKLGIPVVTVIQKPRQFVVTLPYASHSGFNTGCGIAEASNFGDDDWVDIGVTAPRCGCYSQQIHLDMTEIIAVARPHLLRVYLQRGVVEMSKAFPQGRVECLMSGIEHYTGQRVVQPEAGTSFVEGSTPSGSRVEPSFKDISVDNKLQENKCGSESSDNETESVTFGGARILLQCPAPKCDQTFTGGRSKLWRLMEHVVKKHPNNSDLSDLIKKKYPPKPKNLSKCLQCSVCKEFISGNLFHLKKHHKKKHPGNSFSQDSM